MRMFVSVGTDHHPFDRLICWIDTWVEDHPDVSLVVQHGYSRASAVGENHAMMTADALQEHYGDADIVVSQVGPGTIADANKAGVRPIVVPRDPALGEVVDGHQFDFGEFMAARGRCDVITTEAELGRALQRVLDDREAGRYRGDAESADAAAAVARLVAEVIAAPPRRFAWRRVSEMLRRASSGVQH